VFRNKDNGEQIVLIDHHNVTEQREGQNLVKRHRQKLDEINKGQTRGVSDWKASQRHILQKQKELKIRTRELRKVEYQQELDR